MVYVHLLAVVLRVMAVGLWVAVRIAIVRPVLMVIQVVVGLAFVVLVIGVIVQVAR